MNVQKAQFRIGGMSCSFCVGSIKKAYSQQEGVKDVSVSLSHEEALIQYDPDKVTPVALKTTLRQLGYTIRDPDKVKAFEEQRAELRQGRRHLQVAGALALASFGLMLAMWLGWMQPWFRWPMLALALATMFAPGWHIKKMAFQALRRGILNQHNLLEFGAFAGLLGGLLGFVNPQFPIVDFFAVAVFITTYHILSGYASLLVRTRASQAVQKLLDLQPASARVIRDGTEEEIHLDQVRVGDRVRVRPGENVPIDGVVVEGDSSVDESLVTGESIPAEKTLNDEVIGGSLNQTGTLVLQVTRVGEDSFLNQIAHRIEEARAMKPGVMQLVDVVLKYYVPGVLIFAGVSFAFWTLGSWLVVGTPDWTRAGFAALAVLVMGYPCALGMATPLALIRGGGMAAEKGILMRSGEAFPVFPQVKKIVLDKTGTITRGKPAVVEVKPLVGASQEGLLSLAAAAESSSEHPLARAVVQAAEDKGIKLPQALDFQSHTGQGVAATVDGQRVFVGKPHFLKEHGVVFSEKGLATELKPLEAHGRTVVVVAHKDALLGLVSIADTLKSDAKEAVQRMKQVGMDPVMITGDNERTARAVAREVGIETVIAEVLPEDKVNHVRALQQQGHRVAMVGDGINDAPALMQADVGIAIGAGTDIAIESSDVILIVERLGGVVDTYFIAKNSYRKTIQNLVLAFSVNAIGVPAATTGLVHPVWAMIAMVTSVSTVLLNSFAGRLLSKTQGETVPLRQDNAPDIVATTAVFDVPTVHCNGCLNTIRKGLIQLSGVQSVEGDLGTKRLIVTYDDGQTSRETICATLNQLGFVACES